MYTNQQQINQDILVLFKNLNKALSKHTDYRTNFLEVYIKYQVPVSNEPDLSAFKPDKALDLLPVQSSKTKGAIDLLKRIETARSGYTFTNLLDKYATLKQINQYRFEKVYFDLLKHLRIDISDQCTLQNTRKIINYLKDLAWSRAKSSRLMKSKWFALFSNRNADLILYVCTIQHKICIKLAVLHCGLFFCVIIILW